MADAVPDDGDARAQRAIEQARLRKERREAKLRAGGSARLNKITGLGGREPIPQFESEATPTPTPAPASAPAPAPHADPDEVDISEHYYEPKTTNPRQTPGPEPAISEDQLRQMMLGFDRSANSTPGGQAPTPDRLDEDPLMKMMSQMMSGGGFGEGFPGAGGASPFPGIPGMPGFPGAAATTAPADPYTSIWRILHALVALGLGLYIILLTPFSGSKIERERAASTFATDPLAEDVHEHRKKLFFWTFATAETVLLTTRFFMDKGRAPPAGIATTVVGFLPEPFKGYAGIALRYGKIFTTVRADMLACIFVLGLCSWFRG